MPIVTPRPHERWIERAEPAVAAAQDLLRDRRGAEDEDEERAEELGRRFTKGPAEHGGL